VIRGQETNKKNTPTNRYSITNPTHIVKEGWTVAAPSSQLTNSIMESFNSAQHILWTANQEIVSHSQTDTVMSNQLAIYQSQVIHLAWKHWQTVHTDKAPLERGAGSKSFLFKALHFQDINSTLLVVFCAQYTFAKLTSPKSIIKK